MNLTGIFIVDGLAEIHDAQREHTIAVDRWENKCWAIRESFQFKTSRVKKNKAGDMGVYSNWYQVQPDSSLKIVGKEEPDYESLYPPKPEDYIVFEYQEIWDRHIIVTETVFQEHIELFRECYSFPFSALIQLAEVPA